jgi:hypothetical protein
LSVFAATPDIRHRQETAGEAGNVPRLYPVHHLDPMQALLEVQAAYPDSMAPGVDMRPERTNDASFLRVTAPPAAQEAIARILSEKDVAAPSVTLQVVLLDALDASLPAPDLPGGASAALKDVRSLFPFKGYRIRHTAAFPASRQAGASLGNEFVIRVDARPGVSGSVEVSGLTLFKGQPKEGMVDMLTTSFSIRRGETVVLGTSLVPANANVNADVPRALVVLVTALP